MNTHNEQIDQHMQRFIGSRTLINSWRHDDPDFYYFPCATKSHLLGNGLEVATIVRALDLGLIKFSDVMWMTAGEPPVIYALTESGIEYLVQMHLNQSAYQPRGGFYPSCVPF